MRHLLLFCLLAFAPVFAFADGLRVHIDGSASSSRILATGPADKPVRIAHEGDRLTISTDPPAGRATISGHAPLVLASTAATGRVVFQLSAGAVLRQVRRGTKVTIDLFSPVDTVKTEVRPTRAATPSAVNEAALVPGLPAAFAVSVENRAPKTAPKSGMQALSKPPAGPPQPAMPADTPDPSPSPTSAITAGARCSPAPAKAILLPFSSGVGVAALRRRGALTLFFDEGRPIDLSALSADPLYGSARVLMRDDVTELLLPIGPEQNFGLTRQTGGWCLTIGGTAPERAPIAANMDRGTIRFLLHAPGKVLTAADPSSGATLLIGSDRAADSAVFVTRRSELFSVERSAIGVVVEPFSDRIQLKPVPGGFALLADDAGGLSAPRSFADGQAAETGMTHILDVKPTTTAELGRRLREQLVTAASTPARARLPARLAAAQTLLELGMGREAGTLIRVAFADDPSASLDPSARFLQVLADVANDPSSASFSDPRLPATDETNLWRALTHTAPASASRPDVAFLVSGLPLLLSYPEHLRDLASGLAAPLLLADGRPAALAALAELPSNAETAVTKADGLAAAGDGPGALTQLDRLARSDDLGVSSGAILSATLLRNRRGELSPKAATDLLERHRLDWRATGREGPVMLDEASLARRAGQDLTAIQLWREVERRFPALRDPAQSAIVDTLASLAKPRVATALSAADFVTIVTGSTAELAAHPDVAAELGPALADRLEMLDLPVRATEILRKLMDATPPGASSAKLGEKLARMLLDEGKPVDAEASLDQSDQPGLPPVLAEQRRLTRARALERQGKHGAALVALEGSSDADGQDLRASILAADGRWHDAKLALLTLSKSLPEDGLLQPAQADMVMRLATAASRDGDKPLLERLARQTQGRWPDPELRRVFDLITAPVLSDAKVPIGPHPGSQTVQTPSAG